MNRLKFLWSFVIILCIGLAQNCKLPPIELQCPKLDNIIPTAAKFGDTVSIIGSNFVTRYKNLYKISIDGTDIGANNIIGVDSNKLQFKVPVGAGSGAVTVTMNMAANCFLTSNLNFTYRYTVTPGDITNPFAGRTNDNACLQCFSSPQGLDVDTNGNILVADQNHHVIKKIDAISRDVTIIAGRNNDAGYGNSLPLASKFKSPNDVVVLGPEIYVADKSNNCIRKIPSGNSNVTTITGLPDDPVLFRDGALSAARFREPTRMVSDGAKLLIVTEPLAKRVRLIDMANNSVSTSTEPFNLPFGVDYSDKRSSKRKDDFKIFVGDPTNNLLIKGLSRSGGLTTIPSSFISQPNDIASDGEGNLFVLDRDKKQIFVIYPDNTFSVIAGNGINGTSFTAVSGIAIDKTRKTLYVSNESAQTIIKIKFL